MIDRITVHEAWLKVIEKDMPKYVGTIFGGVKIFTSAWIPKDRAVLVDRMGNVLEVINIGEPPEAT